MTFSSSDADHINNFKRPSPLPRDTIKQGLFLSSNMDNQTLFVPKKQPLTSMKALEEFKKIIESKRVLVSTGCTKDFCQAGRMVHTDEPKIGENRPLETIKEEALAFLWELWQDGIYSESQYEQRVRDVLRDIEAATVDEDVWIKEDSPGKTATWRQTAEELQHGLRLAWKNSRKCIMRSHYLELKYGPYS